jgi:hypothetical protein
MAAAATKNGTMGFVSGFGAMQKYTVLLDTSFAAGGEALDLTADFKEIHACAIVGNDANADNVYAFNTVVPGAGTALTDSNFLISVAQSNNTVQAFDEANTVDLSSVGELGILVIGEPAIQTSWA